MTLWFISVMVFSLHGPGLSGKLCGFLICAYYEPKILGPIQSHNVQENTFRRNIGALNVSLH